MEKIPKHNSIYVLDHARLTAFSKYHVNLFLLPKNMTCYRVLTALWDEKGPVSWLECIANLNSELERT